ncbi:MAG: DUF222 domain-containing protein [Acidimicrobiales bacterium]
MFGVTEMREIREAVGAYAGGFDPALVTAADAQRIVEDAVSAENMLATIKALAARRVSETELWRTEGDASPAHQLARKSGTSVGKAREALETAGRLGGLPAVEAAARRGELSPDQVAPIADAASKAPGSQGRLLTAAKAVSLGELRDACARTKAAAEDGARHRAIHASRFLRRRHTADGAGELLYRSTLEEVAEIYAIAQGRADRRFRAARAAGRHEPGEAYLADGLLDAVRASQVRSGGGRNRAGGAATPTAARDEGEAPEPPARGTATAAAPSLFGDEPFPDSPPPSATVVRDDVMAPSDVAISTDEAEAPPRPPSPVKVIVRIDWDALIRGWPIDGEVCEIAGLGPVAVSAVRAMIASGDSFLAAVVTKGVDVVNVAHLGRRATAFQRSGLEWLSPECITLGCNAKARLEIDHRVDWADSKITMLRFLEHHCSHHHDLKTVHGWALVEGTGKRLMVPPDDPRHPRHSQKGPAPPGDADAA